MNNIIILLRQDGIDDSTIYELRKHKDMLTLNYSNLDNSWSNDFKGLPAYSLMDLGDNLVFVNHDTHKETKLDYREAEALRALLKLYDTSNTKLLEYKLKGKK